MTRARDRALGALGPGILYAAVSVGASHLVQSTRAGAAYGLGLLGLILVTFVFKYPAFRFGAQYASATGNSLLCAYRQEGHWAVFVYVVIALGTMFAALPAVTLVTAGLAKAAFGLTADTLAIAALILAACAAILVGGGYRGLDRTVKLLMCVLAVATVVATALVLPDVDWSTAARVADFRYEKGDVFFIVALLGLMPSSVDLSVWHSLWSVAQAGERAERPTLQQALGDFHVGYGGSFVLAVCFVLLGAGVMYGSGVQFEDGAAGFGTQLIDLYTVSLGNWSELLIGGVAVAVMLSTVLAGLDGYPRAAVSLVHIYGRADGGSGGGRPVYVSAILLLAGGSLFVLHAFATSLRTVVDVASTIMFLFAPVVAWLNHRVMTRPGIPAGARPGRGLRALSAAGIVWLGAFSAYYLYLRFAGG